jgi:hypothetical protein
VTVAPIPLARGNLASVAMAAVNLLPFCRRATRSEVGVLKLKNFSQFALISAAALPVLEDAGAEEEAAVVAGDDDVAVGVLVVELELLQAAAVAVSARPSAAARMSRRAKTVNRMTRLLRSRSDVVLNAAHRNKSMSVQSVH